MFKTDCKKNLILNINLLQCRFTIILQKALKTTKNYPVS